MAKKNSTQSKVQENIEISPETINKFNSLMLKFFPTKKLGYPKVKRYQLADGFCLYWAFIFAKIHGGEIVEIFPMGDYYHAMVLLHGKYYDADRPQGTDKPINPEGSPFQAVPRSVSYFEKNLENKPVLKKHVFSVISKIALGLDNTK